MKRFWQKENVITLDSVTIYSLMQEEIYRELYMAVRELPEKCQRVFELHLDDFCLREVGA